ncbi:MAG: hypothetical protein II502_03815 [Paludibacteraceae bacterium]|nr:hypothetical protein [Paludibacteraceae bacterium]
MLAQEGQTVTIERETEAVKLNVTAADGEHTNTYTLNFNRVKSSNALLDSVLSGGVAIPNFRPEQFYYFIDLPVGTDTANIPTIFAYKAAGEKQTVKDTNIIDTPKVGNLVVKTIITVTAEDNTQQQYDILYNFLKSDADTLLNIRYDGEPIEGFNPQTFQYVVELPVGTEDYPELTWDEADSWQEITKQTVYEDQTKKKEQIFVTSQSGKRNIYMVEFEKLKSDMDMLDAIYLNNLPMEEFEGNTNEYYCILADTATVIPNITFDKGDVYQTVDGPRFFVDNMTTKSLGQKAEITVVAQKGNSRTYTLHFPVALSDNPLLNMIFVSGESLPKFDSEQSDYTIKLAENATDLPIISVNKQEEAQKVDIVVDKENWKVTINVRAEDGVSEFTYNLGFERAKSSDAFLQTILVDGEEMSDFQSTVYEYNINIPYGQTEKPVIEPKQKDGQTVVVDESDNKVSIIVTAADEETQVEYILHYVQLQNDDATLAAINILYDDSYELLPNFDSDSIEYKIEWPVGSTQKTFITIERLQIILSDEKATSNVFVDPSNPTTIYIEVTAQDGKTKRTYAIYQSIKLSDDNTLKMIYIDGKEYREFDPNVMEYTYLLPDGVTALPDIQAVANDEKAEVNITPRSVGDTTLIICEAENGATRIYKILFINSNVNDGLPPQANDILIKRIPGTFDVQIVSLRKNVRILFTDINGKREEYVTVPTCVPNDMAVEYDAYGNPIILDVYDTNAGVTVTMEPNKIYFYCTFEGGKKKVVSGKFMIKN